jgi:hypothetical protein
MSEIEMTIASKRVVVSDRFRGLIYGLTGSMNSKLVLVCESNLCVVNML